MLAGFDAFQGGSHKRQSEKRHWAAEPAGCGISERLWVRKEIPGPSDSLPLSVVSLQLVVQEDLVPHPDGFPLSLSVPTALAHCPLTQQSCSLSLLRQSLGSSQTVTPKGEGRQERGKGQDRKGQNGSLAGKVFAAPDATMGLSSPSALPALQLPALCPSKIYYSSKGKLPTDSPICCP